MSHQPKSYDMELRKRLASLAQQHGQAAIARKTGAPKSSVNRFLAGAQIPAWFLVALCKAYALSPDWLLLGIGDPFQARLNQKGQNAADSLLELMRAMNAVANLQIGALSGERDARRLRDLSDAAESAQRLAVRLDQVVGERLSRLCDRMNEAFKRGQADTARGLRREGSILARFIPASPHAIRFRYLSTIADYHAGHTIRASEEIQQVALLRLATLSLSDPEVWQALISMCVMQDKLGFARRASQLAEALCAMHPGDPATDVFAARLRMMRASILLREGRLHEARDLASRYAVVAPGQDARSVQMNVEYYSGLADFAALEKMGPWDWSKAFVLVRTAIWEEDPVLLAKVSSNPRKHWPQWPQTGSQFQVEYLMRVAAHLNKALTGDLSGLEHLRRDLAAAAADDVQRVAHAIFLLQIEQAGGRKITLARLHDVNGQIERLKPRIVSHAVEAIFHRCVLRALGTRVGKGTGAQLLNASRAFFHTSVAQGYMRFRNLIS